MKLPNWLASGQITARIQSLPAPVKSGVHACLCVLCPILLFLAFFNPFVLDPTRIGWLMEADWGQHVLGWNAFRHMPWSTFNHETLLGAPVGNTIISTDSNPLFAFLFKPFRNFLPAQFQYIGLWFFFCVSMHFAFAYKLIRPHAPGRWTALGGAIALSALPALYYRMRHDTLMAQWLILWALHLFINVPDDQLGDTEVKGYWRRLLSWFKTGAKMRGYAALLGVTGLIHPYILFMVAAIWGGDVLKRFWPAARTMDRPVIFDSILRALFVFPFSVVALWISGSFTKGMSPGAGGFGYYSMGLDAIFNPVRPEFSAILKAWPQDGGQSFEGYQYLGFGLLLLLVIAVILYILTPEARAARSFLVRLKPLTLPFIALFLISLSNHAQIYGYTIWKFAVPDPLKSTVAILRASGRFFWPISYCMVLTALVVLFRSRPRIVAFVLPAILVVQAYDLNGFSLAMRKATGLAASEQIYYQTPSPLWDRLVSASSGIDFYPANIHFNDKLFYELTWRATSQTKPVNTMYAARENLIQIANQDAGMDAFKQGQVNDQHLFVFLKQCDAPASLQPRLRMLDGVWIIPPKSAENLDLEKPTWTPLRPDVRFGWLDQGTCLLDENWSRPDTYGVWSEGPKADVVIPIQHVQFDKPNPKTLDLVLRAQSHKPVLVTVVVNGHKLSEINLSHQTSEHTLRLPASVMRGDTLKVRFLVDLPDSPEMTLTKRLTGRMRDVQPVNVVKAQPVNAKALGIKLIDMRLVDPETVVPDTTAAPAPSVTLKG